MLAGAVAGTLEHTLMFPVDTVKTRMQALAHPGQRVRLCSFSCLTGWRGLLNCTTPPFICVLTLDHVPSQLADGGAVWSCSCMVWQPSERSRQCLGGRAFAAFMGELPQQAWGQGKLYSDQIFKLTRSNTHTAVKWDETWTCMASNAKRYRIRQRTTP